MTNLECKRKAAFAGFSSLEAQIELHYLVYELKKIAQNHASNQQICFLLQWATKIMKCPSVST